MAPDQITEEFHQRALERLSELVNQHRVGHFQVECHILDGDRVMGVGFVEVEVLFKGRFSDVGLPGFSVGTTSPQPGTRPGARSAGSRAASRDAIISPDSYPSVSDRV